MTKLALELIARRRWLMSIRWSMMALDGHSSPSPLMAAERWQLT